MHDIVVDAHEAAMKTGDRALSLVGAACLRSSRLPDCSLRSNPPLVAVGGSLTLGMEASPQAEHVSRHGTHWLFVSCRALIGLARIQRRRKFEQLVDENKIAEALVGQETLLGNLKERFPDGRKIFCTIPRRARARRQAAQCRCHRRVAVTDFLAITSFGVAC